MDDDISAGGTNGDFSAKVKNFEESKTFEFEIPFSSGDSLGHDVNITSSDELNLMLFYGAYNEYLQFKRIDLSWEYFVIDFEIPTSPAPITIGCLTLAGLCLTVFIKKQKNNKIRSC